MKNSKTNQRENYSCTASRSRLFSGENNELVYVKIYKGDWGDWDEKPTGSHKDNEPCIRKDSNTGEKNLAPNA
ncbi:hypothetical protein [Flavobacterium johnsoniae]|jgi:hypothetical protein|uniref:Uncharacterized protein n=1 Tax=Flavobacterium johnsoniae TaxID=986 RepID=A0A1J7BMF0_FLAJO|nr:hypothetical protein [Flavobacterium johnsoniae]OIV39781.1 hypothetical protein BKM63_23265 [Flavobacterium johnsoniae]